MTFYGALSLLILITFFFSAYLMEKIIDTINKCRHRHKNNVTKLARLFMKDQK